MALHLSEYLFVTFLSFQVETFLSVFIDIWGANICDIHYLCDPGWTGEEAKPTNLAWSVSGEPFDVYLVYTSSGQYWLHMESKQLVIAVTSCI